MQLTFCPTHTGKSCRYDVFADAELLGTIVQDNLEEWHFFPMQGEDSFNRKDLEALKRSLEKRYGNGNILTTRPGAHCAKQGTYKWRPHGNRI